MKTKEQILAASLGEAAYKKLSAIKMKAILKAMQTYKDQPEFPEEAYTGVSKEDVVEKLADAGFVEEGEVVNEDIPSFGIVVDGSTTNGNPGDSEYQGLNLGTGEMIIKAKIGKTTNNVCEFMALVHAIKYTKDEGLPLPIYSDSLTAITWVQKQTVKTEMTEWTKKLIDRAFAYLKTIDVPEIRKWKTKQWGENPADFGNKK